MAYISVHGTNDTMSTLDFSIEIPIGKKLAEMERLAKKVSGGVRIKEADVNKDNVIDFLMQQAAIEVVQKEEPIKINRIRLQLANLARDVVEEAYKQRTYLGFTGNTQTSYSVGIYQDGKLLQIVCKGEGMNPPVSPKIQQGQLAIYKTDGSGTIKSVYEGGDKDRRVFGVAQVNNKSGEETAIEILQNWKFESKPPKLAIVFTTGTEYSGYIALRREVGNVEARQLAIREIQHIV